MHLAIAIWAIIASWRTWSWEHFHRFHATILYKSATNLLYIFFTMGYPLWRMQADLGLSYSIIAMLYTVIIFPCTVILFLAHYPISFKRQIYHNLKWIAIYFVAEWIGGLLNLIRYEHGWNLWWSLLFLFIMFPMLRLHYKKPFYAYLLTVIYIIVIFYYFEVPWEVPVEDRL